MKKKKCLCCAKILNPVRKYDLYKIKYCSLKCQNEYQYKVYIKNWKSGIEDGMRGQYQISYHIRKYLFLKYKSKCCKCNWNKINKTTGRIPLEINHIDGNFLNNKESNLELICPNCHSLTSTYKNGNKGNGRKARRKYD